MNIKMCWCLKVEREQKIIKRKLWQDVEIYTYLLPVDVNIDHVCPFDVQTSSYPEVFTI